MIFLFIIWVQSEAYNPIVYTSAVADSEVE